MSNLQTRRVAYGLSDALLNVFPAPIVGLRAPTTADKAQIGQLWVNTLTNSVYVLTSIVNNLASWVIFSGGAGVFSSLTVNPGPTNLSTVGNGAVTIGNATNTGAVTISVGTGGFAVNGNGNAIGIGSDAAANPITIGTITNGATLSLLGGNGTGLGTAAIVMATAVAGDIQIGNTNQTGILYLAPSTAAHTVNLSNGINTGAQVVNISSGASGADSTVNILSGTATAGTSTLNLGNGNYAKTVNIATGTLGSTVNVLTGINSVAQVFNLASGASAANSTVNIMTGVSTAGTSTLNLATGAYAHSINVGTGAAVVNTIAVGGTGANVITVGNTQLAGSISLGAAMTTGTINIGSNLSGLVTMPFVSVTAAGTTVVNNVRVGQAIYTGNVTGNGTAVVLTLTNSLIAATSSIFLTVSNLGTNDAQMTLYRVKPGAGTCAITLFNNGAAALNGDIQVSFWLN